jgi:hypothetical protein
LALHVKEERKDLKLDTGHQMLAWSDASTPVYIFIAWGLGTRKSLLLCNSLHSMLVHL